MLRYARCSNGHCRLVFDGSVRLTVTAPEDVALLSPYLSLYECEQDDPWMNGPAFVPLERRDACWHFSAAGARHDYPLLTDSEITT